MTKSTDPEEWFLTDWVEREFVDYVLEPHEKKTIATIKANIKKNAYKKPKECYDHMEVLETLANKFKSVMSVERSVGKENWDVEEACRQAMDLYGKLSEMYQQLKKQQPR